MSVDFIPRKDNDVAAWIRNFANVLSAHAEELDITPEEIAPVGDGAAALYAAIAESVARHTAARTATACKDARREEVVNAVRTLARRVNAHPAMTPALRVELGFREIDTLRTPKSVGPEQPSIWLDAHPGCVMVHFGPNPLNERMNAKPSWAKGGLVYRKGADEDHFRLIGYAQTSPYMDTIVGSGADYTYVVRYQGTKSTDLGTESPATTVAARGALAA